MFRQLNLFQSWTENTPTAPATLKLPNLPPIEIERRAYQRAMRLSVRPNGAIKLTASKSTSVTDMREFALSQFNWIEKALSSFHQLRDQYPEKKYEEGEEFLYQGRPLRLQIQPEITKVIHFEVAHPRLICRVPLLLWENESPQALTLQIRKSLRRFYADEGQMMLFRRVEYFAEQMDLYPRRLSFRSQKTRWGSCSSKGCISLNWRLIVAPPEVADYVVVHELAHLKHYNHSAYFWNLVAIHIPDYKVLRTWLKRNQYQMDFLAERSELHPG